MDLISKDGWAFFFFFFKREEVGPRLRACVSMVVIYTHSCSLVYQLKQEQIPAWLGPGRVSRQKAAVGVKQRGGKKEGRKDGRKEVINISHPRRSTVLDESCRIRKLCMCPNERHIHLCVSLTPRGGAFL